VSSRPAAPGPRLVYDADAPGTHAVPGQARSRSRRPAWLLIALAAAVGLLAAFQWQRAAALEARVGELSRALATAQAEIGARRAQLDAIRASVDDVRARVDGLVSLAGEEPTAPAGRPAERAPAH
jgi:hypothetical protein